MQVRPMHLIGGDPAKSMSPAKDAHLQRQIHFRRRLTNRPGGRLEPPCAIDHE